MFPECFCWESTNTEPYHTVTRSTYGIRLYIASQGLPRLNHPTLRCLILSYFICSIFILTTTLVAVTETPKEGAGACACALSLVPCTFLNQKPSSNFQPFSPVFALLLLERPRSRLLPLPRPSPNFHHQFLISILPF